MGFLAEFEKKQILGPGQWHFITKVKDSPDKNLRRFIYTSLALTSNNFLNAFFNGAGDYGFLKKYKKQLDPDSAKKIFKYCALHDLASLIGFEELRKRTVSDLPAVFEFENVLQFENDALFVLDCTAEDRELYADLKNSGSRPVDEAPSFYRKLLEDKTGITLLPSEKAFFEGSDFERWMMFSHLARSAT